MEKPKPSKKPAGNLLVRVEPVHGETFVYWVQSLSRAGVRHRVELQAYNGNGACGCESFEFKCRGHLERGAARGSRFRCSHIRAAREFAMDDLMDRIAAEEKRAREERAKVQASTLDDASGEVPDWGRAKRTTHSD